MFDTLDRWLDTVDEAIDWSAGLSPAPKLPETSQDNAERSFSLTAFLKRLFALDSWTFYVDFNGNWTGAQIEALLNDHGVKISGRMAPLPLFTEDDLFFDVPLTQAKWAEFVMLRAGIPLKYGLYSAENRRRFPQAAERAAGDDR